MTQTVKGVVAMAKNAEVAIADIVVPDPGPGEAVVAIKACGVCHTDLHYREGGINDDFPFLLGHEASGIVESVGEGVTDVAPGDFVILNWRAVCGQCRSCLRGKPHICFDTHNAAQKMTLADGTELSPALGIGAFAEKTLVAAGQCTKVDPAASPAAVDIDDRKLEWARGFGATHTVNSANEDPVARIAEVTGGNGVDVAIEAIGLPEVYRQCFEARDLAGTVVLVGVPRPDMTIELPFIEVFGRGGALKSSWYGDCLPSRDFPMLIDLYLQGRLDLDGFVSETIPLDGVEEAFHKMERGEVLRSVVMIDS